MTVTAIESTQALARSVWDLIGSVNAGRDFADLAIARGEATAVLFAPERADETARALAFAVLEILSYPTPDAWDRLTRASRAYETR